MSFKANKLMKHFFFLFNSKLPIIKKWDPNERNMVLNNKWAIQNLV